MAVPDDGNCTSTGPHLDPFERGEMPACDTALPQTCQVGDLAGKHGSIVTTDSERTYQTSYTDDFTAVSDAMMLPGACVHACLVPRFFLFLSAPLPGAIRKIYTTPKPYI